MNALVVALLLAHAQEHVYDCGSGNAIRGIRLHGAPICSGSTSGGGGSGLPGDPVACSNGQYVIDQNINGILSCASVQWQHLGNVPLAFPPTAHQHDWGDVTGEPATFPPAAHTHPGGDVTSAVAAASALAANGGNCPAGQAPLGVDASGNVEGCWTPAAPGGAPRLDEVLPPSSAKTFNMTTNPLRFLYTAPTASAPDYEGAFNIEASGGFSGDLLHVHQFTGNPGAGSHLIHAESSDPDVVPLHLVSANTDALTTSQRISAGSFAGPLTGNVTGTASSATALAADPGDCVSPNFARGVNASGTAQCAQPAYSELSGAPTLAPVAAKYIVQTADATLSGEQALGALATGILKNTTTTGVLSIAAAGTDYAAASHSHTTTQISGLDAGADFTAGTLPQARGGTGAGALTCTGAQKLTSNGTSYSCAADIDTVYTLPDATNVVTGGIRLTGDLGGTATSPTVLDDSHQHTALDSLKLGPGAYASPSAGDLAVGRAGGNIGVVYWGNSGSAYMSWNGTDYDLASANGATQLKLNGSALLTNAYLGANPVRFGSGFLGEAGDIGVARNGSPTTGAVYFGNAGTGYLYWSGSAFQLGGGPLTVTGLTAPNVARTDTVTNDATSFNAAQWLTATRLGSVFGPGDASGPPGTGAQWWHVMNVRHRGGIDDGNEWGLQLLGGMTGESNRMWFRTQNSGTWQSWKEFITDANRMSAVPGSATAACKVGEYSADASYFYICHATNTWRRVATSSW